MTVSRRKFSRLGPEALSKLPERFESLSNRPPSSERVNGLVLRLAGERKDVLLRSI